MVALGNRTRDDGVDAAADECATLNGFLPVEHHDDGDRTWRRGGVLHCHGQRRVQSAADPGLQSAEREYVPGRDDDRDLRGD